jgi:hypothetical protein
MAKTTHTARGTCQVCGAIQAIDNASGITAKHGYKVAGYGFFNGVCPGAQHVPAEKSLVVTFAIIVQLTDAAIARDAEAKGYRDRTILCTTYTEWDSTVIKHHARRYGPGSAYTTRGDYVERAITPETPAHIVDDTQTKAAAIAEQNARYARSHVAMMREFIVPRLGQPFHAPKEVERVQRKEAVEGMRFPTKVSRKEALDKLNRQYAQARKVLTDAYLNGSRKIDEAIELYYAAYDLHQWRPKHSAAARALYPNLTSVVDEIEALVSQREEIKNAK